MTLNQKANNNSQAAQRKCLGECGQMFESTHPGNRICYPCKNRRENLSRKHVLKEKRVCLMPVL